MEVERVDRYDRGMRELLSSLSEEVLRGVLSATTHSLVHYGSVPQDDTGQPRMDAKSHAVSSILMYSDPLSLLNKPRLKKAYLASYLNQKGVKMTMPPTKNSLCKDVLNYWGQEMPENVRVVEDEPLSRASNSNLGGRPLQTHHPPITNDTSQPGSPGLGIANGQNIASPAPLGLGSTTAIAQTNPDGSLVSTEAMEHENAVSLRQREAQLGQQLGREFSVWFYERLNTLTDFTTTHFWPECNFRLELVFANQPDQTLLEEIHMNGEACCAKMKDLVAVRQLYFNPNTLGSGIRGYLNPHGLAQVMVCGTVHLRESGAAVGVFEQMFGLMKDPRLGNNYKIKFSVMRLREGSHLAVQGSPPELLDSTLVGIIEEVDDD